MREIIEVFNRLREDRTITDFAIAGSYALSFYCNRHSEINDIDIYTIDKPNAGRSGNGYTPYNEELESMGFKHIEKQYFRDSICIHPIPVFRDDIRWEAVEKANTRRVQNYEFKVLALEYLTCVYLKSPRKDDVKKVKELLNSPKFQHDKLTELITRFKLQRRWSRFQKMVA